MTRYPRAARDAKIKCLACNAPVAETVDGGYACVDCGRNPFGTESSDGESSTDETAVDGSDPEDGGPHDDETASDDASLEDGLDADDAPVDDTGIDDAAPLEDESGGTIGVGQ